MRAGSRLLTLLLVVVAHVWLGWLLTNYRPDGRLYRSSAAPAPQPAEVLLVLDFKTRAAAPARDATEPARRSRQTLRPHGSAPSAADAMHGGRVDEAPAAGPDRALDLRLLPVATPRFERPDPLARAAALPYKATRYDRAWISDGNLTEVIAHRSMIAGVLLGALGALRKPCTEKQRSNYDAACVPAQYEHTTDE